MQISFFLNLNDNINFKYKIKNIYIVLYMPVF